MACRISVLNPDPSRAGNGQPLRTAQGWSVFARPGEGVVGRGRESYRGQPLVWVVRVFVPVVYGFQGAYCHCRQCKIRLLRVSMTARQGGVLDGGAVGREEFCVESSCRYVVYWLGDADDGRGVDVSHTDQGRIDRCARFRRLVLTVSWLTPFFHCSLSPGIHSIERSAQEDTLLVLFSTAISNLVSRSNTHGSDADEHRSASQVLFRYNFALGRDITGLFQSFQSSSMMLDPKANPSLFQSMLVNIIKVRLLRTDYRLSCVEGLV